MVATRRQNKEHRFAADNLSAYIDGELSARDDARIKEHLRHCASCRQDAATLRATANLLRAAPRQPLPRSFVLGPEAVTEQKSYRRWSLTQTWLRASSAVVSMLLVVLLSGDLIMSQEWFAPKATMSMPQATMAPAYAIQEAVEVEKEVERVVAVEKVVEKQVEVESVAEAPAAPMITSVRPQSNPQPEPMVEAASVEEAEAVPMAKMVDPVASEDYAAPGVGPVSPQIAPAAPQTSSAPGMGGGGQASNNAADSAAPESKGQPRAADAQIRAMPTEELVAMAVENLEAPSAPLEKGKADSAQSNDGADQAIPMAGSQESAADSLDDTGAESAPMAAEYSPAPAPTLAQIEVSPGSSRHPLATGLRQAALVAFGALLILLAGLLLVRQRISD